MPNYNDYLIFEGISVDEQGKQHYLDVHIAYRQACLNAIEYLTKFGYSRRPGLRHSRNRAGARPHLGRRRYSQRLRHACGCRPTFSHFDVMPSAAGPIKHIKGGIDIPMSPDK